MRRPKAPRMAAGVSFSIGVGRGIGLGALTQLADFTSSEEIGVQAGNPRAIGHAGCNECDLLRCQILQQ